MKQGLLANAPHLPRWCIGALLLILFAATIATPLLRARLVDAPLRAALDDTLAARAAGYAGRVDAYIGAELAILDQLAADDDAVAALRAAPSPAAGADRREQWQASVRQQHASVGELFLLGTTPDNFPLKGNYLAEALYEQAIAGASPPPRAALVDQWDIFIARPVTTDGTVAGALLARIPLAPLRDGIHRLSDGRDHIALRQRVESGKTGELLALGPAPVDGATAAHGTAVPNWFIQVDATAPLIAAIPRPKALASAALIGLWSLALLLAALLLKFNLRIRQQGNSGHKARLDPRDDLFTEHFIREATSYLDPLPSVAANRGRLKPDYRYPRRVFRNYDIRGKAGSEITGEFADALGRVLGTLALERGEDTLVVATDGRISSPLLGAALIRGILASGCDVINIGMVPTPVLNFALQQLAESCSGVMVTASHNPVQDNGFKIIFDNHVLSSAEILDLHDRMEDQLWLSGDGQETRTGVTEAYLDALIRDIRPLAGARVVVDCGNGVTSLVAAELFRRLGCTVIELFCTVDGNFPNHPPDPTISANLSDLIATVHREGADLGVAFDGDGDRLVAVAGSGRIVWPDELMMIFVKDILMRHPGADVVFDVKCSRRLPDLVRSLGGNPVMWKTGHAHMRNKIAESGAPVGGEFSGHLFFNDRWYGFDDGLYAAARLLEILTVSEQTLDSLMASFPTYITTAEIKVAVDDEAKFAFVEALRLAGDFAGGTAVAIDGIRVEYPDGWGLIRASNTSPALTLRFEADNQAALERIQATFRTQLLKLDHHLALDF
ncbi:MAG: phosphomannomutase/phosphoglucomutase [Porticoccaceae bacterium]